MKKAFITGAAGFLGSHLVEELYKHGYSMAGLIQRNEDIYYIKNFKINIIKGDLLKPETFARYIPKNSVVFHCASLGPGFKEKKRKYFLINVEGTKNLLKACLNKKISKFVYISSGAAVGVLGKKNNLIKENTFPQPDSYYGESKLAAEKIVEDFAKKTNIPCIIIRPFIIYGPRMPEKSGAANIFRIAKKPIIPIIRKLNGPYDFCYVKDVVTGIILASKKVKRGVKLYNLSNIRKQSYMEIILTIKSVLGTNQSIINIPLPIAQIIAFFGDILIKISGKKNLYSSRTLKILEGNGAADCKKAVQELNYKQNFSLEEGIKETVEWLKNKN
ncbi:NAD-dependent epimerase/dehydratase family protein [Candidatus Woesearchaeota archaeon]|nr:NAD-dependent epimerase/dehydratase family protein [Candidatus Woesearchaeota archaeon]